MSILNEINDNFMCISSWGFDNNYVFARRPYGGCAIFWRKALDVAFKYVICDSRRVIALILEHDNFSCLLINAYMPYENPADQNSTDDFVAQLGHVASIMDQYTNLDVIFGGDLNIDFNRNTTHTLLLREFINSRDLKSSLPFNDSNYY
jgi:hypothetical protein